MFEALVTEANVESIIFGGLFLIDLCHELFVFIQYQSLNAGVAGGKTKGATLMALVAIENAARCPFAVVTGAFFNSQYPHAAVVCSR